MLCSALQEQCQEHCRDTAAALQQHRSSPGTARSRRLFLGQPGSSGARPWLSGCGCSSEPPGLSRASLCAGNSSSFWPCRLRRAGLMSGRRRRRDPELEVTEPATDGAGDGMREGARLPASRDKGSAKETARGKTRELASPCSRHGSLTAPPESCQCPPISCTICYLFESPHCKTQKFHKHCGTLRNDSGIR